MENAGYLESIITLFNEFNSEGVNYCHWKSNINLARSLKGLTDLDILIDRSQVEIFKEILFHHDIKAITSASTSQYPAIEDFLGIDKSTGKLFHLHVHYQLVLGEQYVKNYHLPVEQRMLEETELSICDISIPSPDRELIILVIRSLLKYRDRDVIKDIFSIRSPGLPVEIQNELKYLYKQTTQERISTTLEVKINIVSSDLILNFLDTLMHSPQHGWRLFQLRRKLRKELSPYQRRSRWKASFEYYRILIRRNLDPLFNHTNKKQPVTGGMTIAFIGADGAGKSTIIRELQTWLSWKLDVIGYYMGSQEPSQTTVFTRFIARISNSIYHLCSKYIRYDRLISKALRGINKFLINIYHLSTAYDRYHRFLAGRQRSIAGTIVIFDRYPLQGIHNLMQDLPMDGPRINKHQDKDKVNLSARMSNIENDLYQRISPPDHIFILNVSPEISKLRKPDHNIKVLQNKSQVIKEFNKDGLHITEIDSDKSLDQVLFTIKSVLWDIL